MDAPPGKPALRLVMMGTGEFALPTFRALYDTPHTVAALVTQPERTGQGHHRGQMNIMRQEAEVHGTPVLQPPRVNAPESLAQLKALSADLFVVAAYGQILSRDLLSIPRLGSINVHASLLPKYRGAAPVAYAILNGDAETGVTIMQVLPELDAGPVLAVARTPIGPQETAGELEDRLAHLAAPLVPGVLDQLATGAAAPLPQDAALVTRAPKLRKEMGAIDWSRSAAQIDCQVRAMQPWPHAYSFLHAAGRPPQRLLILSVRAIPKPDQAEAAASAGATLRADAQGWFVRCGDGAIEILRVQPEGKRPMTAAEFLRGRPVAPGDRLETLA
jgi:methionyl-tRNA formyltransferase